jgi:hypothetical protein
MLVATIMCGTTARPRGSYGPAVARSNMRTAATEKHEYELRRQHEPPLVEPFRREQAACAEVGGSRHREEYLIRLAI